MSESQTLERAIRRRISDFRGKAGPMALRFAYHAALPVALDADLLHLLRINFFLDPPERLPYTAEADLLLSSLCTEIRDGLYEIESSVRDHLLAELFMVYGQERIRDIATLLWQYTENYAPWEGHPGLQRAQQLTALNFLEPQQAQIWLNTAETSISQGPSLERQWFVAMRQDLQKQQTLQEKKYEDDTINQKQTMKITTILIVDDNIRLAEALKQAIEARTKYTVIAVNTAQEVFAVVLRLRPNLLLLDSQLPESGLELYDALQEYEGVRGIPTIMMGVTLPIEALNLRDIYHLRKPLDVETVLNMITNVLAEAAKKQTNIPSSDELVGVSPERLEEMQEALEREQELQELYKTFLQFVEEITHSGHSQLFLLSKETGEEEKLQLIAYSTGSNVVLVEESLFKEPLHALLKTSPRQSELDIPLLNPTKTGVAIGVVNVESKHSISPSVSVQVEALAATCAIVLLRIQEKQVSRLLQESFRLYTQNRFYDAQALYEQLLHVDRNNAQAWQGQGLTQAMNGQHQKAFYSFDRALKLDPTLITALNGKGTALNMLHRNQEALEVFEQVLELEPDNAIDNAIAWNGQGEALSALNRPEQALYAFDMALRFDPDMAQARSSRSLLLRLNPENADVYIDRGNIYYDRQGYPQALADYDRAISLNPENAEAYINRGNVYYEQQKYEEALADYSKAIVLNPNDALAYNNRGLVYTDLQEYEVALEDYSRAITLNPENAEAYVNRGNIYYEQRKYEEALADCDRAIALNMKDAFAYNIRGNVYYSQQKYEEALADYSRAIVLNPEYIDAYSNRGNAYAEQQEYEEALADYSRAIALNPEDMVFYNNRGNIYYTQQKYEEAIKDYSQVLRLNPDYNVYLNRGYSYLYLRDIEQARADFIKGAEKEPDNVNMAWMVIFTSMQKEHPGSAVAERLEEIALINPQVAEAQTCLGVALGLRGRLKEGLAKLDEALQVSPESQDDNFWKGIFSAYYGQSHPEIAFEVIEKALADGLPPVLLTPLYWLQKDKPQFFAQYAKPLLESYRV